MERDEEEDCVPLKQPHPQISDSQTSDLTSTLLLDHVGEVVLTVNSDGLSWKLLRSSHNDESICLIIKLVPKMATHIKFSDVYAAEFADYGIIHGSSLPNSGRYLLGHNSQMYRFTVHGFERSKTLPSVWVLAVYTFGHKDLQICQMWVNRINDALNLQLGRPKNLMVFIHPRSGKGNGCKIWETVTPVFSRAKVKTKVIVTQRAGQALDAMVSISNQELNLYDGVITVGGDGFFNEILNGFLKSRHKAPYPPAPSDFIQSVGCNGGFVVNKMNETVLESSHNEDHSPLLPSPRHNDLGLSNCRSEDASCRKGDQDPEFPIPNERFRFGIIPAGSTDAVVMCTTGARDPITSALHIVLGKKVHLDLAQVVRWKMTSASKVEPHVCYAASFAGNGDLILPKRPSEGSGSWKESAFGFMYGFYGDVIAESEKLRWMGPRRYDYAGTKVFLRHRSYQAELAYLEVKNEERNSTSASSNRVNHSHESRSPSVSEKVICRVNCNVCRTKPSHVYRAGYHTTPYSRPGEATWLKSKGRYLSVGAAIISCRNERAPDGLVADAHLSDGLLHLILIKDCPHAHYLWHLTQLARKGGNPLNFKFVEHHMTPAFTFTSEGNESVWNLDGELFQAHQLSAQVFRGLVSLFATGPEV